MTKHFCVFSNIDNSTDNSCPFAKSFQKTNNQKTTKKVNQN